MVGLGKCGEELRDCDYNNVIKQIQCKTPEVWYFTFSPVDMRKEKCQIIVNAFNRKS